MNQDDYNIINGEICCWRCGLSKKEARRYSSCYTGWGRYDFHMWKAPKLSDAPLAHPTKTDKQYVIGVDFAKTDKQ